jgi:mannose-1-phosphate guanylyltransferase
LLSSLETLLPYRPKLTDPKIEEQTTMIKLRDNADAINLWGLVLAAGDGKRLEQFIQQAIGNKIPKQYVNLVGRRSMLEHTFLRAEKLIPQNRILTIVSKHHLKYAEVRRQLWPRPKQSVVVQPANRETGPGVLLPLMHIYKRSPEAVVAVFPSDHFIWEEDRFMDHVKLAAEKVGRDPARVILLAVEAQEPEVDYGYIVPRDDIGHFDLYGVRRVSRFIEKPSASVARSLVKAGGLWNTMTMVFKVKTLLHLVKAVCPNTSQHFNRVLEAIGTESESDIIDEVYRELEPLNFSKGILERIAVIFPEAISALPVLQVFWSDWGSPQRVMQVQERLGLTRSCALGSKRASGSVLAWQRQLA